MGKQKKYILELEHESEKKEPPPKLVCYRCAFGFDTVENYEYHLKYVAHEPSPKVRRVSVHKFADKFPLD